MKIKDRVPEAIPCSDEQRAWLVSKLATSKAFRVCRGQFDRSPVDFIDDIRREFPGLTKSQFSAKLHARLGAVRIMAELYNSLMEKYWNVAADDLRNALLNRSYFLVGETVPIHETTPMTLVVFDPEKTFAMLHWLFVNSIVELGSFAGVSMYRHQAVLELSEPTRKLGALFPSLCADCKHQQRQGDDLTAALWVVHAREVLNLFNIPKSAMSLAIHHEYHMPMLREAGGSNFGFWHPFAFLFVGKEQGEVLEGYSRLQQGKIASWQFRIPAVYRNWTPTKFEFGFHPEVQHELWERKFPAFVSKKVSAGHGVVLFPPRGPIDEKTAYCGRFEEYLQNRTGRFLLKHVTGDGQWRWEPEEYFCYQ
ncbi:MAG: hypothetical protein V4467_03320 [Patescibacteria group bacterium]